MKIKALSRSESSTQRECSGDLRKHFCNLDPQSHPMQRAREYTRAVQGAKLERMFAKPLVVGNLGNGHMDSITASSTSRRSLVSLVSGSADGQIKLWDLTSRTQVAELSGGHTRAVSGLVYGLDGQSFYSCGEDGVVRLWSVNEQSISSSNNDAATTTTTTTRGPLQTWRVSSAAFKSMDHHWMDETFVTASSESVCVWSPERTAPLQTHKSLWGNNSHATISVVRYNPSERHLLGLCTNDRGVGIHDSRVGVALRKSVLRMRSNCLEWNPMEPMTFAVGNEDYQAYTFDMRRIDQPTRIYKGHVGAILSLSWSPTGREFATGSYDRTIRIFSTTQGGTARDVYHTKRMQRVTVVHYTNDNGYIVSGSDDTNLRLWRAVASQPPGQQRLVREEAALLYRQTLVKRYQHMPAVARISKARRVPNVIRKQTAAAQIQKTKADRKQSNRIQHSKPGTHRFVAERQKVVTKEIK